MMHVQVLAEGGNADESGCSATHVASVDENEDAGTKEEVGEMLKQAVKELESALQVKRTPFSTIFYCGKWHSI